MLRTSKARFAAALSCAAALLLSGCATPCKTTVEPGRHSLTKGVPAQVSPDVRLTLVGVEDSRCPDGVQCIWPGRIVYQFELHSCGKTERFSLTPVAASPAPGKLQDPPDHRLAAAPGMQVTLNPGSQPAPRGTSPVSPVQTVDVILGPG